MKLQLVGGLRREGNRNIIMDLSFNPEVADERMAIYFNLKNRSIAWHMKVDPFPIAKHSTIL